MIRLLSDEAQTPAPSLVVDTPARDQRRKLFGIDFDLIDAVALRRWTRDVLQDTSGRQHRVAFSNPEFVLEAVGNRFLREYLNHCELNVIDGTGLLLAFRYVHGVSPPERLTGTHFVAVLAEEAAATNARIFLLGGKPGVAERAAGALRRRWPDLNICGTLDGYEGVRHAAGAVRAAGADALMVCLGNPHQERWIADVGSSLPVKLIFGNGGALDFWSGDVPMAPAFVQRAGFEWLFRLATNFSGNRLRRQLRLAHFVRLTMCERRTVRG